ncbi:hypothetical protein Cgig2_016096 [Carnegiea gigantea]|uniref:Uncharacterized protein n=1 Tax=Carnegiea gigantea TaxID=171969 RepID=A0A9Q1KLQ1_9CARY|nr:hypothetical protein Cgig2_016096 [Carnegiea gigantea]
MLQSAPPSSSTSVCALLTSSPSTELHGIPSAPHSDIFSSSHFNFPLPPPPLQQPTPSPTGFEWINSFKHGFLRLSPRMREVVAHAKSSQAATVAQAWGDKPMKIVVFQFQLLLETNSGMVPSNLFDLTNRLIKLERLLKTLRQLTANLMYRNHKKVLPLSLDES